MQEPPAALSIMGGSFVEGGDGMARYAWVRLSVLCHLASCWDGELSRRSLLEGNCVRFSVVGGEGSGGVLLFPIIRATSRATAAPAALAIPISSKGYTTIPLSVPSLPSVNTTFGK